MDAKLQSLFDQKTMTAREAMKLVQNGDRIFVGTTSSVAAGLCEALTERARELDHLTVCGGNMPMDITVLDEPNVLTSTFFMGPKERSAYLRGKAEFTSCHLSQVDIWCKETSKVNVAFLEVSLPDENGYMSYGAAGVCMFDHFIGVAETVILQVNANVPYVYGERNLIHVSQATALVRIDRPMWAYPGLPIDDGVKTISNIILEQVPDGACIQLGLGGLAGAVGVGLKAKNDLGAHTELFTESMMELMEIGVLNNSRKTWFNGQTVASFAFGSQKLYQFIDRNPQMYFAPFTMVNDPVNIAKNDNMISINTALTIDLFGQVAADNLSGKQYSATGGQLDFVRGAQMSKGGKSFIAVTAAVENKKGRSSRIVPQLPLGTSVTTPRSDVQYIVTEYGCVNLKPLNMSDRARALIELAHPDFREELRDRAKEIGLI